MPNPNGTPANLNRSGSSPQFGKPKRVKSLGLSEDLIAAIEALPQVQTPLKQGGWSFSYYVEVVLRNHLGLPADYDGADLQIIRSGGIVE